MNRHAMTELTATLRAQRATLFKEILGNEADLDFIAGDREAEIEERAQEERAAGLLSRLDERSRREVEEIDAALRRIGNGTYGTCTTCGGAISQARLAALPATPFCIACAQASEGRVS